MIQCERGLKPNIGKLKIAIPDSFFAVVKLWKSILIYRTGFWIQKICDENNFASAWNPVRYSEGQASVSDVWALLNSLIQLIKKIIFRLAFKAQGSQFRSRNLGSKVSKFHVRTRVKSVSISNFHFMHMASCELSIKLNKAEINQYKTGGLTRTNV